MSPSPEEAIGVDATGWSGFRGDLARSVEAIGAAPMIVVLPIALGVALYASASVVFVGVPILLFDAGFFGTQRVWFAKIYGGATLSAGAILQLTRSFIVRFVVLAFLISVVVSPFLALAHSPHERVRPAGAIVVVAIVLALDVLLTFVVPALALTTRSVRESLRIGLRMISEAWPSAAWYLLTPGLTLGLFSAVVGYSSIGPDVPIRITLLVSTGILGTWFRGAIVSFYLRQPAAAPIGSADGS